jgi:hypothetical protein
LLCAGFLRHGVYLQLCIVAGDITLTSTPKPPNRQLGVQLEGPSRGDFCPPNPLHRFKSTHADPPDSQAWDSAEQPLLALVPTFCMGTRANSSRFAFAVIVSYS